MEYVSVVIVNWNAGGALYACLNALFASAGGEPHQVILDFNVSAYRYYRKHRLPSAVHPLTMLVGAGLLASLALRSVQALWPPRR